MLEIRVLNIICWGDVDFDRGYIHIKMNKSGRMHKVPMNSLVMETLRNIKKKVDLLQLKRF